MTIVTVIMTIVTVIMAIVTVIMTIVTVIMTIGTVIMTIVTVITTIGAVMSVTPEMVWTCQTEGQGTEHVVATYLSDNFVPASQFSGRILHLQVGTAL